MSFLLDFFALIFYYDECWRKHGLLSNRSTLRKTSNKTTVPELTRIIIQDDYLVTIAMTLKTHVARNQSAWLSESIHTNSITSSRPLINVLKPPIKAAALAGEVL